VDTATLLLTAGRNLRRVYGNVVNGVCGAPDVAGLTAFANSLAGIAVNQPVTITTAGSEGASSEGQITMPREVWLAAAEELLADPVFLAGGSPLRPPRVIMPDYRRCNPN
jgi:hypothetical protein